MSGAMASHSDVSVKWLRFLSPSLPLSCAKKAIINPPYHSKLITKFLFSAHPTEQESCYYHFEKRALLTMDDFPKFPASYENFQLIPVSEVRQSVCQEYSGAAKGILSLSWDVEFFPISAK